LLNSEHENYYAHQGLAYGGLSGSPQTFKWETSAGNTICFEGEAAIYDGSRHAFKNNPALAPISTLLEGCKFIYIKSQRRDLTPWQTSYDKIDGDQLAIVLAHAKIDGDFKLHHPNDQSPIFRVGFRKDGKVDLSCILPVYMVADREVSIVWHDNNRKYIPEGWEGLTDKTALGSWPTIIDAVKTLIRFGYRVA